MSRLAGWIVVVCAGCAAPQEQRRGAAPPGATPSAAATDDDEPVCHEESVTGSNLSRTVCRSKSDQERERDEARTFSTRTGRTMQPTQGN